MSVRRHISVQSMKMLALIAAGLAALYFGARTFGASTSSPAAPARRAPNDDAQVVAALDTEFQRAVKNNDAARIDRILADNFVLVTGKGQTQDKEEQLREARSRSAVYEHQEDTNRTVRVWGNTAVVTALLWAKGTQAGKSFEYRLWFSDVYVRTAKGWKYVFGQAAQPLGDKENTSRERQVPQSICGRGQFCHRDTEKTSSGSSAGKGNIAVRMSALHRPTGPRAAAEAAA